MDSKRLTIRVPNYIYNEMLKEIDSHEERDKSKIIIQALRERYFKNDEHRRVHKEPEESKDERI